MKKIAAFILALFASQAHAVGAWDILWTQIQIDDSSASPIIRTVPPGNEYGIGIYGGAGKLGYFARLGSGLTFSGGYLNIDAYPSSSNPAGYLTSISSAQVQTALGFTPIGQAAARTSISLTTTGSSGAATYNSTTGVLNVPSYAGASMSINDSPGRSLVTTTSSTGFQVSATRVARVCYEGSFATTSTIGGPATATVFLETADTNSTTPGDWTTKARQVYSNTITLAIVLNQVQGNNWAFCRDIPAGKYVRIRSGAISGTASASINTEQQETLF